VEILKQPQYQPLPSRNRSRLFTPRRRAILDPVPIEELRRYEEELYRFLETRASNVLTGIADKKILDDELKAALERR
jgi:F-type H+-transporting ATPase subunit alpha